jgi:hypothetical protein
MRQSVPENTGQLLAVDWRLCEQGRIGYPNIAAVAVAAAAAVAGSEGPQQG